MEEGREEGQPEKAALKMATLPVVSGSPCFLAD